MSISNFKKCSDCGACYNICPKEAIKIQSNGLFYTPIVNMDLCIECGLCENVCPVNQRVMGKEPIEAFAGWHKDKNVVISSSSGGIFYGLAQNIISEGGIVYGAAYTDDYKKVIITSTSQVPLNRLQKSKYVESEISDTYKIVKKDLDSARKVLFCGTPCQVAGLTQFLSKKYDNLITCDFVCGGLPSHEIYRHYLEKLEKKYHSKITKVDFRPKTHGWKRYALLIEFENGKKYNVLGTEDPYLRSFLYGKYTVRDYCLECKFSDNHFADITIADFWKHKTLSELENDQGISLILANSNEGAKLINNLHKDYSIVRIKLEDAKYNHKQTKQSEKELQRHKEFLDIVKQHGFISAYKMFFVDSKKDIIKNRIARIIFKRWV